MKADHRRTQVEEPINANNFLFARLHHQTSEEGESRSNTGGLPNKKSKTVAVEANSSGDGATIEVIRRPRGRPPGSKNKPKPPPLLLTRDTECSMRPVVLEIPGGADVVDAISRFSRQRNTGLCILTGSGTVTNVSLRQPSSTPGGGGAIVTFHGRFDILSVSATFLPPSPSSSSLPSAITESFTISLAGPQGQIIGGSVAGPLAAVGAVFVVAASFDTPLYHRLPIEEDLPDIASRTVVSAACEESHHHSTPPSDQSCGMPIYSCHVPSDVFWASTSRPPF